MIHTSNTLAYSEMDNATLVCHAMFIAMSQVTCKPLPMTTLITA